MGPIPAREQGSCRYPPRVCTRFHAAFWQPSFGATRSFVAETTISLLAHVAHSARVGSLSAARGSLSPAGSEDPPYN